MRRREACSVYMGKKTKTLNIYVLGSDSRIINSMHDTCYKLYSYLCQNKSTSLVWCGHPDRLSRSHRRIEQTWEVTTCLYSSWQKPLRCSTYFGLNCVCVVMKWVTKYAHCAEGRGGLLPVGGCARRFHSLGCRQNRYCCQTAPSRSTTL